MNIYIVQYHHRHGTDAWACQSEERVLRSISETIMDNLDELDPDEDVALAESIGRDHDSGRYLDVIRAYEGYMSSSVGREEWFEWSSSELLED